MMWMLDTNIISYFFRGVPPITKRILATSPADLAVPTVVVYELETGLLRLPESPARAARLEALHLFLAPLSIVPFDRPAASEAAVIAARLAAAGTPIGPHDVMIAATALAAGAILVTHNTSEFGRITDLVIEDWYEE